MTDELDNPRLPHPDEQDVAERLCVERPVPRAGFRGRLHRHLDEQDPGYGPRPDRLGWLVASYIGAGGVLIVLAALGVS